MEKRGIAAENAERVERGLRVLADKRLRALEAEQRHICAAVILRVDARVFAKLFGVADHIENIVANLECEADVQRIIFCGFDALLVGAGRDAAHHARRHHQVRRFACILDAEHVERDHLILGLEVNALPADHAALAGAERQYGRRLRCALRTDDAERLGAQRRFKRLRQKAVAREQRLAFTENLVVCGLAAAHVVVVHAGQIVVDQRIGVHHFDGAGKRHRFLLRAAAQLAELERQHGAHALSAAQK